MGRTVRVFVSYSREDEMWVQPGPPGLIPWIAQTLRPWAKSRGLNDIRFWSDPLIEAGVEYREKIASEIQQADIVVLLLSQDFLASEFIREFELPRIKARLEQGAIDLIPILVGPVSWQEEHEFGWLADRQIVPQNLTPLIDYLHDRARWEHVKVEKILPEFQRRISGFLKGPGVPHTIAEYTKGIEVHAEKPARPTLVGGWTRRRTWILVLSLAALAILTAVLWYRLFGTPRAIVTIVAPRNDGRVSQHAKVRGTIVGRDKQIWVIVRPRETNEYWVQERAQSSGGRAWRVTALFGRSGAEDRDKRFQVMAVVNPKETLSEGTVLGAWPEAEARSEVIEVIRE
jgi:hypothetical protein